VSTALLLAAVLAAGCVVLVALPFLREPAPAPGADVLAAPDETTRRRLELVESRDRALGALKELEQDHVAGRISDEDYRALVGPLRREAAHALRALDDTAGDRSAAAAAEGGRL
jgi:hypothetical protein